MSETGHTPGPWSIQVDGQGELHIAGGVSPDPVTKARYLWVASVPRTQHANPMWRQEEEREANAQLIASAPDLLAAAESLADHLDMWRDSFRDSSSWDIAEDRDVNGLLAAIARARGLEFEPDCNHDPAAVRDGVCECGTQVYDVGDPDAAAEYAKEHAEARR